jgi:RHS repeat-associated protein
MGEAIPTSLENPQGVTWCPSDATEAVYCPAAPRFIGTLNRNVDPHGVVTWAFARTLSSITTFAFDGVGALTGITDAAGDAITESSGAPGSGQCPTSAASCQIWTSSVSGRSITLAFDSLGNLLSGTDQAGTTTAYCHFGQTCAPGTGGQAGDLASKTLFSGTTSAQTTTYTYDTSNANVDLQHDVLVVDPPGNQAINETQNTYGASGRITNQTDPGGGVFTFAYSGSSYAADNGSSAGGTTTVTSYPNGTGSGKPSTVDVYSYIDGVQLSEAVDTAGVDKTKTFGRDTASLIPTQSTDLNGNTVVATVASAAGGSANPMANVLSSTDAVGDKSQYAYTALNLPWCTVDPAETANGVVCPSTEPSGPPAPGTANPNPGVAVAFYDASGRVTAKTDALGNTTTYSFTSGVSGVPNGLSYCSVDPVDYQKGVVCPAYGAAHVPGTTTDTFDAAGDVLTSTDALGNVTTNTYDTSGHLHSTTDPDGTTTTNTYNGANQVIQQTQTFGATTATTLNAYDALGHKYCTVAPSQAAKGVTCPTTEPTTPPTPANPPTLISDPYLGATIDTFDAIGRVIQVTSPTGGVTYNAYDDAGNKFCTVGPLAAVSGIRCPSGPPATPPTPSSDPYLGATIDTSNALGQLVQETNPLGGITTHAYDPNGNDLTQVVSSSDATNDPPVTTAATYDADNRVTGTTVAPGTTVASTTLSFFDPNGNVFCTVSPTAYAAGASTYQCPTWQPIWITAPPAPGSLYSTTPTAAQADNTATTFYNPIGNVDQTTTATGGTTVTGFDADSRTVCSTSATDFTTWIAANPSGTYPYACPTPPLTTPPTGSTAFTTTIVDADGHATSVTDPVGNTTTNTFGPDGETLVSTAPGNQMTTNCYYWQTTTCASGAPSGGGVANALYATTQPGTTPGTAGPVTTNTYYPGGSAHVTISVSGTTTDTYDQGSGLLTETNVPTAGYAQTPNVTYTYWPDGSRESMIDGNGSTSYAYDAMANLTQQQFTPNGTSPIAASTVSDTYFDTGAKKSIGYPTPSSNVTHAYDAAGNLATVTDWLGKTTTIADVPSATTTTYPNATQVVSTPDLSGGTTSVVAAPTANPNSPLVSATYQRNSADQVTSETDTGAIASSTAYTYDPNQRLGSVNTTSTSYDPASDPTALGNGTTQTFNGAGQVTSSVTSGTTATLSYNPAGDRTAAQPSGGPSTQYAYDQNNQLASVSTTPPIGTAAVSAGYDQTLGLRSDGTVWAWGNNGSGQLGNGTTTSSSVPVQVTGLTNVVAVSAGYEFSSALKADGTVWTWGSNTFATLGNGTTTNSDVPVQVSGLTGVTQISAGGYSMEALKSDGTVWDWGSNGVGTLGNGTTTDSDVPVQVSGLTGVTQISAGFWYFESALKSDGTVWTWGFNDNDQLGNNSTTSSDVPVEVTGLPSIKSVSAGAIHVLALSTTGSVWGWGNNTYGQLGNGTTTTAPTPIQVPGIAASSISAGTFTSYALSSTGTTEAWGSNTNGELDNGTTTQENSPVAMAGITNATQVSGGGTHVAILTTLGTIEAVGGNGSGQLGNGSTTDSSTPVTVTGWNAVTHGTGSAVSYSYAYDGDGLRVGATTSSTTKTSVWDSTTSNPEILSDGNNSYIYGASGQVIEQISTSGTPSYFVEDQLGSTRALTNASGQVVATYSYNANGVVTGHTGTVTTPIGYAGAYTDPSGLLYLVHRYYDPVTGQFLSVDPLLGQTQQAYQYAGNDPVNSTDPNGQMHVSSDVRNILHIWGASDDAIKKSPEYVHVQGVGDVFGPVYMIDRSFHRQCTYFAFWSSGSNCNPSPHDEATLEAATRDVYRVMWDGLYQAEYPASTSCADPLDTSRTLYGYGCFIAYDVKLSIDVGDQINESAFYWASDAANMRMAVSTAEFVVQDVIGKLMGRVPGKAMSYGTSLGQGICA